MNEIANIDNLKCQPIEWVQKHGGMDLLTSSLPKGTDPIDFVNRALMVIQMDDKGTLQKILAENPRTVIKSILMAAQSGLSIDFRNHGYLVPRNLKRTGWSVTFQAGYKGLIYLMRKSPMIAKIGVQCVYKGDEFEVIEGTDAKIIHRPLNTERKDEDITDVYAYAKLSNGEFEFIRMTRSEVERIRKTSKDSREDSNWNVWYDKMTKKTCLIQLSNILQLPETQLAVQVDTIHEIGGVAEFDSSGHVIFEQSAQEESEGNGESVNVDIDTTMTEEKDALIIKCKELVSFLGVKPAKKTKMLLSYLKTDNYNHAKVENLKSLYAMLDAERQKRESDAAKKEDNQA